MDDYIEHLTIQKDAYDSISLLYYGDEAHAGLIAMANPEYADVLMFDANIRLRVPVLAAAPPSSLPPWRAGNG